MAGGVRKAAVIGAVALVVFAGCQSTDDAGTTAATPASPGRSAATTPNPPDVAEALAAYLADPGPRPPDALLDAVSAAVAAGDDLSQLLHQAADREAHPPGRTEIAVPIGFNQNRRVIVRTPDGYDPDRPWPMLVAYHVWGGNADRIIDRLETLLGDGAEEFVIAAPDDYRQTVLDAPPPVTSEHVSVWRGVKEQWHIDSDRVYLSGYSLGGETVMTLATLHPGALAGAVAMAAGYSFPSDVDGLWERFLPQLAGLPVLHVWGVEDTINIVGLNGRDSPDTLAAQNERLDGLLGPLGLHQYAHVRLEGVGHDDAHPSTEQLAAAVAERRQQPPQSIDHSFRYIHQADVYWIEGHEWLGDGWLQAWPTVTPLDGESDEAGLSRTIHELLGRVKGSIGGQTISVDSTHLADLTVWISDGMIDWSSPVTVEYAGRTVFSGVVVPDTAVALTQAVRTMDFDRLRWAGIRIDATDGTAHVVTSADVFPPILREVTLG